MRKLSEQEKNFCNNKFNNNDFSEIGWDDIEGFFQSGFIAGLDYAQRKLDAYTAFVAGKITLKELEEVING